jgi:aspartate 1-decarboxylase
MIKAILSSKIHRATVSNAKVEFEESMAMDEEFLQAPGIVPYVKSPVGYQSESWWFEPCTIKAPCGI